MLGLKFQNLASYFFLHFSPYLGRAAERKQCCLIGQNLNSNLANTTNLVLLDLFEICFVKAEAKEYSKSKSHLIQYVSIQMDVKIIWNTVIEDCLLNYFLKTLVGCFNPLDQEMLSAFPSK